MKLADTLLLVLIPALVSAQRQRVDSVIYRTARPPAYCEDLTQYDSASLMLDEQHPRYFVEVAEVSRRGNHRILLTSRLRAVKVDNQLFATRVVCERVNPEVSRDSKIVVRPNRSFLFDKRFEGNFSVSARIESATGSRNIEVPGYSMIGKEAQVAPVGVQGATILGGIANETRMQWTMHIKPYLMQARAASEQRQSQTQSAVRRFEQRIDDVAPVTDSLKNELARIQGAPIAPADSVIVAQRLIAIGAQLAPAQRLERIYRDSLAGASDRLKTASRFEYLRGAQNVLREKRHVLIPLHEVIDLRNRTVINALARASKHLPTTIVELASTVETNWKAFVATNLAPNDSGALESNALALAQLSSAMDDLTEAWKSNSLTDEVQNILLGAIKDASVDIAANGAQIGENLILTLTDSVGDPMSDRSQDVRMRVRDFGLLRRVSDAILLVNTWADVDIAQRVQGAQVVANAQGGTATAFDVPVPVRGSPTAGVSFTWTYSPRRDDDFSPLPYWLRATSSWLEPGFGFAALAGSMPMKRVVITPNQPSKEEPADSQIAYAVGGILTVFDGALAWSGGWTVNGSRPRAYTGIGISFLNATEKARDLFKGLAP